MNRLNLNNHVRFCEVEGQLVFLDLKADRYFSLPPEAQEAFVSLLRGESGGQQIEALCASGLLVDAPAGRPLAATFHTPPANSFLEDGETGQGLGPVAEVLFLVLIARHAVQRKRLPRLLASSLHVSGPAGRGPREKRDRALGQFLRARRAVPVAPNCLYDSLALRRFLQRRSIPADLVIGTKLHPFAAHCWLQDGGTILNDSLAAARGFSPILIA